jgi:hypothetical protein
MKYGIYHSPFSCHYVEFVCFGINLNWCIAYYNLIEI